MNRQSPLMWQGLELALSPPIAWSPHSCMCLCSKSTSTLLRVTASNLSVAAKVREAINILNTGNKSNYVYCYSLWIQCPSELFINNPCSYWVPGRVFHVVTQIGVWFYNAQNYLPGEDMDREHRSAVCHSPGSSHPLYSTGCVRGLSELRLGKLAR